MMLLAVSRPCLQW